MRGRAAFVYHGSPVDRIGRTSSVDGTLLPCSGDGPDTRLKSRVVHACSYSCIRRRR